MNNLVSETFKEKSEMYLLTCRAMDQEQSVNAIMDYVSSLEACPDIEQLKVAMEEVTIIQNTVIMKSTWGGGNEHPYLIIVADAVSVNFSARCKFSRLNAKILPFYCVIFKMNNYPVILYTVYFYTPRVYSHCVVLHSVCNLTSSV